MKKLSFLALLTLFSAPAAAYVGPGLGMGVIGTIFGVLAAIVLAVFGLFWYPLKRRFGKRKDRTDEQLSRPSVAEKEQTDRPDNTVPARPDSPSDTSLNNPGSSQPGVFNEAPESNTANHADRQLR